MLAVRNCCIGFCSASTFSSECGIILCTTQASISKRADLAAGTAAVLAGPSVKRATSTIFLDVCTSASAVWTSAVCSLYVFCSADQGLAVYWRSRDSARDRGCAPCSERLASGRRRCRADLRGGLVGVREERLEVLPALVAPEEAPEERQLGLRHDLREALD